MKKRLPVTLGIIIVMSLAGYIVLKPSHLSAPTASPTPIATDATTLTGKITCLPHKDTEGPHDLMCAIGLHTADNKYYALTGGTDQITRYPTGTAITVTGKLAAPDPESPYQLTGTLAISTISQ